MRKVTVVLVFMVLFLITPVITNIAYGKEESKVGRTWKICVGKDFNANGKLDDGEPLIYSEFQGAILFDYPFLEDFYLPQTAEESPYFFYIIENGATGDGYCFRVRFDDVDPTIKYRYWVSVFVPEGCHPTTPMKRKGPFMENTKLFFGCRTQTETQFLPIVLSTDSS